MADKTVSPRTPRASEGRESEKREIDWKPSELLPTPNKREGIEHRYVRISARGQVDNVNFSQARRDGWEPVAAEDYRELKVLSDRSSDFPEGVVIGGLVLCSRPVEIGDKFREMANEQARRQIEAVDNNYMKEDNPNMPKFSDRRSKVSFGRE